MRRLAAAIVVSAGPALWATSPALAAGVDPPFECPDTLGGQPLTGSPVDETISSGGRPVYFQMCLYSDTFVTEDGSMGGSGVSASPAVYWQESADAAEDPRIPWCVGGAATAGSDTGSVADLDDLEAGDGPITRPEQTYSTSYRAYSDYSAQGGFPEAAARELAAEMLASVAERAAPCSAADASGVASAPPEADGSRAVGTGLLALGGGLALAAGAGSLVAGRRARRRAGPPGPPPPERLYSGEESVRILRDGGLLQEVRGGDGELIGYRPSGELASFIRGHPQWQPELSRPLPTPGGRATHIAGVAFQEGPDGTIESITIALREAPAGVGAAVPVPPAPSPTDRGISLADRLGRAYMNSLVTGVPLEAVLEGPAGSPEPASGADRLFTAQFVGHAGGYGGPDPFEPSEDVPIPPPDAPRPPARPDERPVPDRPPPGVDIAEWLATPGPKAIGVGDLHRLAPQVLDPGGRVTVFPFKGVPAKFSIGGGRLSISIRSPELLVPDVEVAGSIGAGPGGLKAKIESTSVLTPARVTEAVQGHLDRINERIGKAGLRVADVVLEEGEIRLDIAPNGASAPGSTY